MNRSVLEIRIIQLTAKNVPGTVWSFRYQLLVDDLRNDFKAILLQKHIVSNAIDFITAPSLIVVSAIS